LCFGGLAAGRRVRSFGDGTRACCRAPPARRDWWELNEKATILHGTRGGGAIGSATVKVEVGTVDAPRGRVIRAD